jgi:uncharacterized protein (DUF1330 family)
MRQEEDREILMSAYFIFTREKTLDQAEMDIYNQQVRATTTGYEMKILAAYEPHEDVEGAPTEGTIILEFPTMEAAKAWYDSPAYREVRLHRFEGAIYRATLVQGI